MTNYFKAIRIMQSQITFVPTSHASPPLMTTYCWQKSINSYL